MAVTRIATSSLKNLNKYDSFLGGNAAYDPIGDFESIQTITVGSGGVGSITFSSIPQTYQHLQIRAIIRNTHNGADGDYNVVNFNGDIAANYAGHFFFGEGSSATSLSVLSSTWGFTQRAAGTGVLANVFGGEIIDILDYTSNVKYKTLRNIGGFDANSTGRIYLTSNVWMSTSPLTSITITGGGVASMQEYTSFALYGVK
jgi:hypothetical protein